MVKKNNKPDLIMIDLDRPRFLRFGHKALKQLSALTNKEITEMDMSKFTFDDLEKIYYVGLLADAKENNETLKLEDMEDLLDYADFKELASKMNEAFEKAFGSAPVEVDEKN